MAFSSSLAKKWYENLSVEELEKKYEELKKNYCFDTKEEKIDYIIKNYLNASNDVNNESTKKALEELLNEKTGKEYKIESKEFVISLLDIIDFISKQNEDPFWTKALINFFNNLNNISESEKIQFLIEIVQDKNSFNEFTKEILKDVNINAVFDKYQKLAQDYIAKNTLKG